MLYFDPMLTYRLYFFDGPDRIVNVEVFRCSNDDEARTLAGQHLSMLAAELWQGSRMVDRYEPNSKQHR